MRRCSQTPLFPARPRGLTLVELLVTLAVLALLVTAAVPTLAEAADRRRLAAVSADAAALLQAARTAALVRGEPLRVAVHATPAGQCLLLHAGAAGACTCIDDGRGDLPRPHCADAAALVLARVVPAADRLALALPASGLRHDPSSGTTTPTATLRITGRGGSVQHAVNLLGRVRSCATPAGIGGHPGC